MSGLFGLDYAWGRISAASHRAAGSHFAARYLSYDSSKNLSRGEADALRAGGIDVVVVWETTANRAGQGYLAGAADARAALNQAINCGMPGGRPIYFAVDFDASPGQVSEYFRGCRDVLGVRSVGAYAGYRVIKGLLDWGLIGYAWQTYAWSYGALDPRANLYQYSNGHYVAGVDCDFNRSLKDDYGQFGYSPLPLPPTFPKGVEMIAATKNSKGLVEVFVEKQDTGEVFHTWQTSPTSWKGDERHPVAWFSMGTPGK